jgi:hypothetical protein
VGRFRRIQIAVRIEPDYRGAAVEAGQRAEARVAVAREHNGQATRSRCALHARSNCRVDGHAVVELARAARGGLDCFGLGHVEPAQRLVRD